MVVHRYWLDDALPCLSAAAGRLIQRGEVHHHWCSLEHIVCVTPGRRSGRILLEEMLRQCEEEHLHLAPPRILTPGAMVDVLLEPRGALAAPGECALAWVQAMQQAGAEALRPLLPRLPADVDLIAWHDLAGTIARLHTELAGQMLPFSRVAEEAERAEMFGEADRWRALEALHGRYIDVLHEAGLEDPHEARRRALDENDSERGTRSAELVLVGVVELNAMQRAAAALVSDVTALIHAPESFSDRFDDLGCVIPDAWTEAPLDLNCSNEAGMTAAGAHPQAAPQNSSPGADLIVADRPEDQAQAALRAIAHFDGRYSAEEITIGLGDDALHEPLESAAAWAGLPVHRAAGIDLPRTGPYRLLDAVADFLSRQQFAAFAALLRHPDLERWLHRRFRKMVQRSSLPGREVGVREGPSANRAGGLAPGRGRGSAAAGAALDRAVTDWLSLLDRYFSDHLHERIDGNWLGDDDRRTANLRSVHQEVQRLLKPLLGRRPRPLGEWAGRALEVLRRVYGSGRGRADDPGRQIRDEACMTLRGVFESLHSVEPALQPTVDAATALRLALDASAGEKIPVPDAQPSGTPHVLTAEEGRSTDDNSELFARTTPAARAVRDGARKSSRGQLTPAIDVLGWLELHLDPAPALVLLGVNDGRIPAAVSADAFLPDALRTRLGLVNNARRYARDAYLLHAIARSRERFTIIAGRRAADGEPLAPSRLLLAVDREELPERIMHLTDAKSAFRSPLPLGAPAPAASCRFRVPRPTPGAPEPPEVQRMRVTDFRLYLKCPYRFWLSRVMELRSIGDGAEELDPLHFGSLAHDVLEAFGCDESVRDSDDEQAIAESLSEKAMSIARRRFGARPLPAVRVQLERLMQRLRSFAARQAQYARDGWRIECCEIALEDCQLDIPDQPPMRITGIIDRIDRNEQTGALRIIDYKTSEKGDHPHEAHWGRKRYRGEWVDLQLPLYRHFAGACGYEAKRVEVGYIVLPRRPDGAQFLAADWDENMLDEAIETARDVVRRIRAGEFWPPAEVLSPHDEFAAICQSNVLGRAEPEEVAG